MSANLSTPEMASGLGPGLGPESFPLSLLGLCWRGRENENDEESLAKKKTTKKSLLGACLGARCCWEVDELSIVCTYACALSFVSYAYFSYSEAVRQPEFGLQRILSVSSCESILYEACVVETWPI
jgi:hypothetical protein